MNSFKSALILGSVALSHATPREPCAFNVTGMFHNVRVTPNPPELERTCRVTADFYATRDIQFLFVRGYVMNEKTGFKYPLAGEVCDISAYFCPIEQGDTRHVNASFYIDQQFPPNTPFSLQAKFIMEDETVVSQIAFHNCTLVKPEGSYLHDHKDDAEKGHKVFKFRYGDDDRSRVLVQLGKQRSGASDAK